MARPSIFYVKLTNFNATGIFCDIVDSLEEACLENNILDIWDYNEEAINELTKEDIVSAINSVETSKLTRVNYMNLLGNVSSS